MRNLSMAATLAAALALSACDSVPGNIEPARAEVAPAPPAPVVQKYTRVGTSGNEPVIFAAPDGVLYIAALQYLYRSTDGGKVWTQLPGPVFAGPLNLASDSSLAMDPGGRLYFNFDWPYAGLTAVCTSDDHGDTWACNPAAGPGATDRMWVLAPATDRAYMVTNEALYETTFFVSDDGGLTWLPSQFGSGLLEPQTGPLLQKPGGSRVLQVTKGGGGLGFYTFTPDTLGAPRSGFTPTGLPAPMALPSAAFGSDGTLYAVTEAANEQGGHGLVVTRSADEAQTWTALPEVPGSGNGTSIFSWIAAGSAGHVGVLFYLTDQAVEPGLAVDATWSAVWAETYDALSEEPEWTMTTVDPMVRLGAVCIAASCSGDDRFAGDFISAAIDQADDAHLAWMAHTGTGTAEVRYLRIPARKP
ncbi:MAG TPA: sialidase family protein [Solimonas sp.]|nr:sialidase family protein [Solimonas sp.]